MPGSDKGDDSGSEGGNVEDQIFGPTCRILVKKVTNLKNILKIGTIDPYVEVTFENHIKKTKVKDDTKNPVYNEELLFPRANSDQVKVQVKVYHEETLGKDKLLTYGTGTINNYMRSDWHDLDIKLIDSKQRATDAVCSLGVGGGAGEEGGEGDDGGYMEEDEDVYDVDHEEGGAGVLGGVLKSGSKKKKKPNKSSKSNEVSAAVEQARAKINFASLSTKEECFQIRFVMHKARQLTGLIETPLARVTIGGKTLRTDARKGNQPKFNETVVFTLTKSEKDILDLPIEIAIIDTSKDQQSNLVGQYTFDLTVAWVEKDHLLPYKWFALTDPNEPQEGMKGYLNISIQVISPGLSPKKLPKKNDTEIDVASNVFYPPGTSLQPGQFIIKLFTGEDLPQMDSAALASVRNFFRSGEKPPDLVDPYTIFEFAGSKIQSNVQYGTFDPVWNEKLVLHGEFPSMAENFVIRVIDRDDYDIDDLIASKLLKLSQISFSSSDADLGFLPTFGPAYIPLYGSLREHSDLHDKYEALNGGNELGIAYRGRILLELNTNMGEADFDQKTRSTINEQATAEVMSRLRRHKYHLFTSFDTGNMIRETDNQVQFEVSIGDYGNSLSLQGNQYPSTTQPCNAVYDGTQYYFMPWGSSKPTVILHSQWEDVEFRCETLNTMMWMVDLMEDQLRQYRVLERARGDDTILDNKCSEIIKTIIKEMENLRLPVPPEHATRLDQQLYKLRLYHMGTVRKPKDDKPDFVGIDIENPTSNAVAVDINTTEESLGKIGGVVEEDYDDDDGDDEAALLLDLDDDMKERAVKDILGISDEIQNELVAFENFPDELQFLLTGRYKNKSRQDKIKHVEGVIARFKNLCFEPQISIPDVFIWMMSGTSRIAFTRIPVNDIIYTENPKGRGKLCGKTGSFFLKKPRKESIGAHLSLTVWFGKFEHVAKAFKTPKGSEVTVYAETYENEVSMLGNWTTKLLSRPKFSDITGKYEIPKESFATPDGWRFDGDWNISFDNSLLYDNEQGLSTFRETVFEGQTRKGGSKWERVAETWWTDEKGDESPPKDDIVCRDGWEWASEWVLNTNRAVDSEGFEYSEEPDYGNYGPIERNYHLARRRMWTRVRNRIGDAKKREFEGDPEGWEYSKLFTTKFHPKERTLDMVRRRRWNRKLVSNLPVPVVFSIFKDEDEKKKDNPEMFNISPRVMTEFGNKNIKKYQLRAYLYQARGLLGADPTGYSDPYARVIFGNRSGCTRTINQTCSPLWDTTVILNGIEICGDRDDIINNPPDIVIELFDEDVLNQALHNTMKIMKQEKGRKMQEELNLLQTGGDEGFQDLQLNNNASSFVNHDKLGRVVCKPRVMADMSDPTKLDWFPITGVKRCKGELLAAFELYEISEKELPLLPPFSEQRYKIPPHIKPELTRTRVEILTWGLRQLRDYKMSPVDSPHLEIEVGGEILTMDKIKSVKRHANFESPHNYLDVMLPKETRYLPPINIRILDNRSFGYTPLVGVTTVKEYGQFRTSLQALIELNEHVQTQKRMEQKQTNIVDKTTDREETPEQEIETTFVRQIGEMQVISLNEEVTENDPTTLEMITMTEKKKNKAVPVEKYQLIENDELGLVAEADAKKKPVIEKHLTRTEIRQQKQMEEIKAASPDDILVSDWWSKYYECTGSDPRLKKLFRERDLPKLALFDKELEDYYNNFNDLMESFPLYKPDNEISDGEEESESEDEEDGNDRHIVGNFKGSIKVYEITETMYEEALLEPPKLLFSNLPTNKKADVLVRVYVAGAMGLTPLDYGGSVDPYLVVKCGKTNIDDRSNYICKEVNPIFGRMFQIRAKLPRDSKLSVKVYDHDIIGANDLIGSTTIDIEDRFLSWRRASCGLTQQYIKTRGDKDRWRDQLKPVDILKRMCLLKGWVKPVFKRDAQGLKVIVNETIHYFKKKPKGPMLLGADNVTEPTNNTSERNKLALEVLHELGAVPEHIETRTLYNEDCPGIPQGKLHMWVDIFPYSDSIPPPIVISPRTPQKYILRCIVYNTEDVILEDTNILGEQMSDIYVKCYFEGQTKDSQETDVHYRSLTGEGNFNWRMIYNFDYIPQEQKMIQKKKAKFYHIEKSTKKVDPIFHIKIYDKDVLSRDDLLGWAEINLTRLPAPTKSARECTLEIYEDEEKHPRMCLFDAKKIKGFWPVYDDSLGTRELTGKVEMELELLTEEEAAERPAGKARDEPNSNPTLEPPNRPETSFNWFTNPWKVFKVLIWRRYKWHIVIGSLLILFLIFIILMFYSAPGAINSAIFN